MKIIVIMSVACTCAVSTDNMHAEPYPFAAFSLPALGGDDSAAYGINEFGHSVGAGFLPVTDFHATVWMNRVATDLGTFGGATSQAIDINNTGWIVGRANPPGGFGLNFRAFLYRNDVLEDLGDLGGDVVEAFGINDRGQIVGKSDLIPGESLPRHAFLWEDGVMTSLGALEEDKSSYGWAINESSQVVGQSWSNDHGGNWRAVLWENGEIIDLGTLRSNDSGASFGSDINELGETSGSADNDVDFVFRHAFLWRDGVMNDLGKPWGMVGSEGYGMNNLGQVVGAGIRDYNITSAMYWDEETGPVNLDTLLPPRTRWRTRFAWDINDAGQISGSGYPIGEYPSLVAFLLSPVTPTITLSQPLPGLAGEVNTLTLSDCTPGTRVYLTYSPRGGGTIIPGCDIQENALQLENPKLAGSIVADANGEGVFTFFVPDAARNLGDILIQAVVPGECAVSNLVVEGFE